MHSVIASCGQRGVRLERQSHPHPDVHGSSISCSVSTPCIPFPEGPSPLPPCLSQAIPGQEASDFLHDMLSWLDSLQSICSGPPDGVATASQLQLLADLGSGLFQHSMQCGLFAVAGEEGVRGCKDVPCSSLGTHVNRLRCL